MSRRSKATLPSGPEPVLITGKHRADAMQVQGATSGLLAGTVAFGREGEAGLLARGLPSLLDDLRGNGLLLVPGLPSLKKTLVHTERLYRQLYPARFHGEGCPSDDETIECALGEVLGAGKLKANSVGGIVRLIHHAIPPRTTGARAGNTISKKTIERFLRAPRFSKKIRSSKTNTISRSKMPALSWWDILRKQK